jgi:hypothetical protein
MSATITCRALGPSNDPQQGQGQANFLSDLDAVAQIIHQRLLLFQGEWWENAIEGLPLWQKILGVGGANNTQTISLILQARILATPYVTGLSNVSATFNASSRAFTFYCEVQTQFGSLAVTNSPTPTSSGQI